MRGPGVVTRKGRRPYAPTNQAITQTYSLPAPYSGWNARGNLANMKKTQAVVLDNWFPGVTEVSLRKGSVDWVTGFAANVRTLIPWSGLTTNKLFAVTSAGFYDATGSGVVGASVTSCTNAEWRYVQFATTSGSYVYCVNGVDAPKHYDGTTWVNPAITGVTPANLTYVLNHKRRLWFIEKNTMNLWYLAADALAGAATQFPVGPLFRLGGSLVAIGTWTIDSGQGPDDYFVIVTSSGEMAIYQGTDPASSTTWALVGVYNVGIPVGSRPFCDFGGDLLYISRTGLVPISKLLQSSILTYNSTLSFDIDGAFLAAVQNYGTNYGWQIEYFKNANFILVNIPVSADSTAYQFVMNTLNKAWCRFLDWDASCWTTLGSDLYFAGGTKVSKAWSGNNDAGAPITGTVLQAYSRFSGGQDQIVLVKPALSATSSATLVLAIDSDYKTFEGQSQINYTPITAGGIWGTSLWDTGVWGGSQTGVIESKWTTVPGNLGETHALRMQLTTSTSDFTWTDTDYAVQRAGIL